jgi:hypothetical protein
MKRILLFLVFACFANILFAQWTTSGNDIYNSNSGNVGVGTTTPSAKLTVRKVDVGPAGITTGLFDAESTSSTTDGVTAVIGIGKFSHSSGTGNRIIGLSGGAWITGSGSVTSVRAVQGNVSLFGSGGATDGYCFFGGIGTGGSGTITNGYGVFIGPFAPSIPNKWGVYIQDAAAKNYFGGSISIGTTSDFGYKLAVNGNAIFTEAKVKLFGSWPDYVFRNDYQLLSLDELEKFIEKNQHLPNIPSAKEVKENGGIMLGEMNAKLLEKVEELTLYILQLKKENDAIKEQLLKLSAGK